MTEAESDSDETKPATPLFRNPVIQELVSLVKADGLVVVAAKLGVGPSTLRNWTTGVCLPSQPNLEKISRFLQDRQTSPTNAVGEAEHPVEKPAPDLFAETDSLKQAESQQPSVTPAVE